MLERLLAALQAGRIADAMAQAQAMLAAGCDHPLALKLRGAAHERAGRLAEAAADFERALAAQPDDAGALNALGSVLTRLAQPQAAVARLQQAIALQPGFPDARLNLGSALEALGELRAAEAAYHSVLEHDPGSGAARAALSVLAARRGDHALARREADRALALGGERLAPAHLALAMADLHAGEAERARGRLQRLLASPDGLSVNARSMAFTWIGDACDRLDDTAGAFEAYRKAGAVLARAHAPRFAAPGQGGLDRVKRLRAALDQAAPDAPLLRPALDDAPPHVFLIGFPRSGTTLMGQILAAHPDVATLDERDSLADAAHAFMEPPGRLEDLFQLDDAQLEPWRSRYWLRVAEAGVERSGRVFVDKLPMNALGLPLIARLFPHARILLMLRDPRDAVFSSFRRNFAISASTYELLDLQRSASFYGAVMDYTEVALERFDPALLRVRYEDLTGGFDETLGRVCRFMGLSPRSEMRDFAARAPSSALATPSAAQVAQGLYGHAVGAWRRFQPQLAGLAEELDPWVRRYGYPRLVLTR